MSQISLGYAIYHGHPATAWCVAHRAAYLKSHWIMPTTVVALRQLGVWRML